MTGSIHRRRAVALTAAAALLAVPAAASAHTGLASTSPARGRTVAVMPATVTLTFTAGLGRVDSVRITRAGRDHVRRVRLNPRDRRQVRATTRRGGAGLYTVTWRVRAVDGHPIAGMFRFRVRRATAATTRTAMRPVAPAVRHAEDAARSVALRRS